MGTSIRVVILLLIGIPYSLPDKLHPSNSAYAATGVPESLSRYENGFARDKHGRITGVDLRGKEITASLLADLGALQGLRSLNLAGTALTDDALRSLGALGSIEKLDLRGCKINAGSLAHLQSLKKLKSLRLSGKNTATQVSDVDIARLSSMENLRALFIDFLPISDTGIRALRGASQPSGIGPCRNEDHGYISSIYSYHSSLKKIARCQYANNGSGIARP